MKEPTQPVTDKTAKLLRSVRTAANWAIGVGGLVGASCLYMLTTPTPFEPSLVVLVATLMLVVAYLGYRIRQEDTKRVRRLKTLVGIFAVLFLMGLIPSEDGGVGGTVMGFFAALLVVSGSGLRSAIELRNQEPVPNDPTRPATEGYRDGAADHQACKAPAGYSLALRQRRGRTGRMKMVGRAAGTNRAEGRVKVVRKPGTLRRMLSWKSMAISVAIVGIVLFVLFVIDFRTRSYPSGVPDLILTRSVPSTEDVHIGDGMDKLISEYGAVLDVIRLEGGHRLRYRSFNDLNNIDYYTSYTLSNDSVVEYDQSIYSIDRIGVDLAENNLVEHWYRQLDLLRSDLGDPDTSLVRDSLWLVAWTEHTRLSKASEYGDYIYLEYKSVAITPPDNAVGAMVDTLEGRTVYYFGSDKTLSLAYVRRLAPRP